MRILSLAAPEFAGKHVELFHQYLKVVEVGFGYHFPHCYRDDFGLLVGPHNHTQCFGQWEQDAAGDWQCCATMAVIERQIHLQGSTRTVLCIGAVATRPDYRGQGLFAELMEHVIDEYAQRVEAFILWSDKEAMYHKFGFVPCFDQCLIPIKQLQYASLLKEKVLSAKIKKMRRQVMPMNLVSLADQKVIEQIFGDSSFGLHAHTSNGFVRQSLHWSVAWQMSSVKIHLCYGAEGKPIAYALEGKGFDLQGVIHEWGVAEQDHHLSSFEWLSGLEGDLNLLTPIAGIESFVHQQECHSNLLLQGIRSKNLLIKISSSYQPMVIDKKTMEPSAHLQLDHAVQTLKSFFCSGLDSI